VRTGGSRFVVRAGLLNKSFPHFRWNFSVKSFGNCPAAAGNRVAVAAY
jgi:hypothetical protein